jgi:hypothetical protein
VVDREAIISELFGDAPVTIFRSKDAMFLSNFINGLNDLIVFMCACFSGILGTLRIVIATVLHSRCFKDEGDGLIKVTP